MKHLKFFEGYMDYQYEEISEDEYQRFLYKDNIANPVNFNPRNLNDLTTRLKEFGYRTHPEPGQGQKATFNLGRTDISEYGKRIVCWYLNINPDPQNYRNYPVVIYQMDDDWILVNMSRWDGSWYRCDQYEGLIKLLTDRRILNHGFKEDFP